VIKEADVSKNRVDEMEQQRQREAVYRETMMIMALIGAHGVEDTLPQPIGKSGLGSEKDPSGKRHRVFAPSGTPDCTGNQAHQV